MKLKNLLPPKARVVFEAGRLWRKHRVGKRLFGKRTRIEVSSELIESEVTEDSGMGMEFVLMLVRHGLTLVGGAGFMTEDDMLQIAAAVSTVAGIVWSAYRKWKRSKDTPAAPL